ncbi:MAG: YggS family pyridoxal phosphate-dependent enzyme [Bacteroidaceae bacterium]|jgi:pyridoxal phosphate enzyme (YggS family)|nr:YggS family pyridoxal phosphate-dependent enzyme [Bacteroidaceae bacterium]
MKANIAEQIKRISDTLPCGVTLIAVSKYHPADAVMQAYEAGQRDFGESKAQDLVKKHDILPDDIKWHFIGHLQSNKIKYIAPFVHLIHSIDSYKLLQEVNRHGEKQNRRIACLLQIHIAQEETKFGFTPDECMEMLSNNEWQSLKNVEIRGIMCMASNTDDESQIADEFSKVQMLFNNIKEKFFAGNDSFNILSAGMSDDYPIAIKFGSNHIRVGSKIFSAE